MDGNAIIRRWPSWVSMLAGIWLFASPWVFGYTNSTRFFWSSLITGAVIFFIALWSTLTGHVVPSSLSILAGAWAIVSPFVLSAVRLPSGGFNFYAQGPVGGFGGTYANGHWNSVIVGAVVVVMGLAALAYKYAWFSSAKDRADRARERAADYGQLEPDCRQLGTC